MGKRRLIRLGLIVFLALSTLVFGALVYGMPSHPLSVIVFKLGYLTSLNKAAYLRFYSPQRRDVGGGYVPSAVDTFLCERAEGASADELVAIAEFYTLQASGREGGCIYKTSDRTSERLAEVLAKKIATSSGDTDVEGEIVLLEEIRRQNSIGKGRMSTSAESVLHPRNADEWRGWKYDVALPLARKRYADWWQLDLSWEQKRNVAPLKDSGIGVFECCG